MNSWSQRNGRLKVEPPISKQSKPFSSWFFGVVVPGVLLVTAFSLGYWYLSRGGQKGNKQFITVPNFPPTAIIQVRFSPKGGCTDLAVQTINSAKTEILIQAYSFTSQPIADALINAVKRGVSVQGCFDKSDPLGQGDLIGVLAKSGVECWVDSKHKIAHSKTLIIDESIVCTGSFNFTFSAENSNLENFLVIGNKALAKQYKANWLEHQGHSQKYKP